MKSIAVETTKLTVKDLAKIAGSEPVVFTRNGHAVCALVEVDDLDIEAWSLGNNPQLIGLLERSRKRLREEGGIPLDQVRERLGLKKKRPANTARRKSASSR